MISYKLDIRHSKTPQWWQRFIEYKTEEAIDCNIEIQAGSHDYITRQFVEYLNTVLELRYDAYYDMGIFGKPHMLEFASDEGHMLFMMEWL